MDDLPECVGSEILEEVQENLFIEDSEEESEEESPLEIKQEIKNHIDELLQHGLKHKEVFKILSCLYSISNEHYFNMISYLYKRKNNLN